MNTEFIEEGPWGRTLVKSLKRVFFLCEQYKTGIFKNKVSRHIFHSLIMKCFGKQMAWHQINWWLCLIQRLCERRQQYWNWIAFSLLNLPDHLTWLFQKTFLFVYSQNQCVQFMSNICPGWISRRAFWVHFLPPQTNAKIVSCSYLFSTFPA